MEFNVPAKEMKELAAGAIVIWGKSSVKHKGSISVALGNGQQANDHDEDQRTELNGYANFRVFMPK